MISVLVSKGEREKKEMWCLLNIGDLGEGVPEFMALFLQLFSKIFFKIKKKRKSNPIKRKI